ncbi:MAG: GNAT family N-acetyltransferase [Actinomycetota bacterium]
MTVQGDSDLSPATPVDPPDSYPRELETVVTLADGEPVYLRPVVPADIDRIRHAFAIADAESIRLRFFTGAPPADEQHLHYLVEVDYRRRLALVALDGEGNSIGIARYEGAGDERPAEVAVVVSVEWRRRGVGRTLLLALEEPASRAGIDVFEAIYQPGNRAVDEMLAGLGYTDRRFEDGLVCVTKSLS